MPIYEYRCLACDHQFETLLREGDPSPSCPKCQATDLTRLLSLFSAKSDDRSQGYFRAAKRTAGKVQKEKHIEEYRQARREHEEHGH